MNEEKENITIMQVKWYEEKTKTYKEEFIRDLTTAMKLAKIAFDEGSRYFTINLITVK